MHESAEVAYREVQYGIRVDGEVKPIAVGPAEANRYLEGGVDILQRERTVYHADVTEWHAMPASSEREGQR